METTARPQRVLFKPVKQHPIFNSVCITLALQAENFMTVYADIGG